MDKREKIRKALLDAWGNVTVDSLVDMIMRIDEPAEPKRDWLNVGYIHRNKEEAGWLWRCKTLHRYPPAR